MVKVKKKKRKKEKTPDMENESVRKAERVWRDFTSRLHQSAGLSLSNGSQAEARRGQTASEEPVGSDCGCFLQSLVQFTCELDLMSEAAAQWRWWSLFIV